MITDIGLEQILDRLPSITLGVLGDLFLDRYLDIDAGLTEPSIETGLDAYQVMRVRSYPGAAGTVINNLVALGVGQVRVISVIGDDGEGYELRQALESLGVVDMRRLLMVKDRRTPTYTKPMLHQAGRVSRELNRMDIKNRAPLPQTQEAAVLAALEQLWPQLNALVVLDQVSEMDCGVVTRRVIEHLADLGDRDPDKLILADSRERVGLFRSVWLKPNQTECVRAVSGDTEDIASCVQELARRARRPVFCTRGEQGILLSDPRTGGEPLCSIPTYPVTGPTDTVGAGDSANAGIACALAAGARLAEAAAFGNLIASITIQQIGITGIATPEQVRRRWQELQRA
jgi:rfaE bifunctional protein kinase chain/domain